MHDLPLQLSLGNRVRRSPYFDATRRWGASAFSVYNHMYMPTVYESPEADFWHLVRGVTLWDVACERQVEISGPDAARFTQYLTPRNLSDCQVGQCKYVLLCNAAGNVLNDPVLLKLAGDRFWLSLADSDILLWAQALALAGSFDVEVCEPDVAPLQVQGPHSPDVMRALFGGWIDTLRYFWFRETDLNGIPVLVSRTGWSSERGYEIFLRDGARGNELWETIMAAGEPWRIRPGAPNTIRRIEGGMLSLGADMWMDASPFELNLGRLVDLDMTADYVGKAALAHIAATGIQWRLAGVELDGAPLAEPNPVRWNVTAGGHGAGHITSCVYSPRLEKNIGLAMLALDYAALGTRVAVHTGAGARTATVVDMPFFDPHKALATRT